MMKANSKRYYLVGAFFAAAIVLVPFLILAQTPTPTGNVREKFCERVGGSVSNISERLSAKIANLADVRQDRLQRISEHQVSYSEKLQESREKWDENRAQQFNALEDKAETDAERQAVVQFKTAMTAAISARRTAVDAAIAAFRSGLQAAISSRKTAADAAIAAYKSAIDAANAKARTDCAAGLNVRTVRDNYVAALKLARDKYNTDRQNVENLGGKVKALVTARRQAMEKAHNDFKTAAEAARARLKAALEPSSPTPTPTPSASPSAT